jgi:hypothetical protein
VDMPSAIQKSSTRRSVQQKNLPNGFCDSLSLSCFVLTLGSDFVSLRPGSRRAVSAIGAELWSQIPDFFRCDWRFGRNLGF